MPLMKYLHSRYLWVTWPDGSRVGSRMADLTVDPHIGYCSECGADAKLDEYWFLIRPKKCEQCGHEFEKHEKAYSDCGERYEYVKRLREKWEQESEEA